MKCNLTASKTCTKSATIIAFFTSLFLFGCNDNSPENVPTTKDVPSAVKNYAWAQYASYAHDTNAFTEGFLIHNNELFESTGATKELPQTRSLFGIVNMKTGKINTKAELDKKIYFGEGIVFLNDKIYQLTYQTKIGFMYDAKTFKNIGSFTYPSKEGWGLTTDGKYIIMSDGTNVLSFLDSGTLQVVKTISVTENNFAQDNLNELEYKNGFIYANIWTTNTIVEIKPENGTIVGKVDLTRIAQDAKNLYPKSLEMNGIAYDKKKNRFLITGKMWPKIYEIGFGD